jgi:hypothetical protein
MPREERALKVLRAPRRDAVGTRTILLPTMRRLWMSLCASPGTIARWNELSQVQPKLAVSQLLVSQKSLCDYVQVTQGRALA